MSTEHLDGGAIDQVRRLAIEAESVRVVGFEGQQYLDRQVHLPPKEPALTAIEVGTLDSLVEYVNEQAEADLCRAPFLQVVSPTTVRCMTGAEGRHRQREVPIVAVCEDAGPAKTTLHSQESFIVWLQSSCVDAHDREELIRLVSSVRRDEGVQLDDDGVTQTVSTKAGVVVRGSAKVPGVVTLAFYRTFPEIEQPAQRFVLRARTDDNHGVTFALYEHGRVLWQKEAISRVAAYLQEKLPDTLVLA